MSIKQLSGREVVIASLAFGLTILSAVSAVPVIPSNHPGLDRHEIRRRLDSGDRSPIAELIRVGSVDAIRELANIATVYSRFGNQKRYPGVADAAIQAIGETTGAQEILGDLIFQGDRPGVGSGERTDCILIMRKIRNEESVRVVGKLLDDTFDIMIPGATDTIVNLGPNSLDAASTFAVWLRNDPNTPLANEKTGGPKTDELWRDWWHKVRDDPEVIRAIAEGRPLPKKDNRIVEPSSLVVPTLVSCNANRCKK